MHQHSCDLEPLSSRITVTWAQAPWHHDSNPIASMTAEWVTGKIRCTEEWLMSHVGWSRTGQGFITLLRIAHNLKLLNCLFLEFSIRYFHTILDHRWLKPWELKPQIKGDSNYIGKGWNFRESTVDFFGKGGRVLIFWKVTITGKVN